MGICLGKAVTPTFQQEGGTAGRNTFSQNFRKNAIKIRQNNETRNASKAGVNFAPHFLNLKCETQGPASRPRPEPSAAAAASNSPVEGSGIDDDALPPGFDDRQQKTNGAGILLQPLLNKVRPSY